MNIQNKPIALLQDFEIIELLDICSEMFGTKLRETSFKAFIFILRNKFNYTTDKQILDICTEHAAQPSSEFNKKFSPSFLSGILAMGNKQKETEYKPTYVSEIDRQKYRQLWLNAVYQDFEDYCKRIEPMRIHVWMYLADELELAGIVTKDEKEIAGEYSTKRKVETFKTIFANGYMNLCLTKFRDMAMKNEHISQYIR